MFTYLDQMSGSWNMDECGDQMAHGMSLLTNLLNKIINFDNFLLFQVLDGEILICQKLLHF